MALKIFNVVAALVLIVTAYRVATRPFRVAKIDYELNQGYATDRWGEPPSLPDAGKLWREEQVSRDDRVTILLCVATIPALIWMGRRLVRLRHSTTNIILAALFALPLLINGCSNSNTALSVRDAKSITIVCFYRNQELPPVTFATNAKQRADIVEHLRNLRWTELGLPLDEIKMIAPDIKILLTDNLDRLHTYELYWTKNVLVDQDSERLFDVTDISKLRAEVTSISGLSSPPVP